MLLSENNVKHTTQLYQDQSHRDYDDVFYAKKERELVSIGTKVSHLNSYAKHITCTKSHKALRMEVWYSEGDYIKGISLQSHESLCIREICTRCS